MRPAAPLLIAAGLLGAMSSASRAETVMQQCGQQYQTAKAGGTLNGMTWNQFRSDCAARLKAQPASAAVPASAAAPAAPASPATAATQVSNPLNPAPTAPAPQVTAPSATSASKASPGRVAFLAREKQCGAEWRANKTSLIAKTPGLSWPKYLSQCNARLKASGT